jgi:hypothetical protein
VTTQKLVPAGTTAQRGRQEDRDFAARMIKKFSEGRPRILQEKEILKCSLCFVQAPDGIDYRGRFYCKECAVYKKSSMPSVAFQVHEEKRA